MKKFKKTWLPVLAAALSVSLIAGCGSNNANNGNATNNGAASGSASNEEFVLGSEPLNIKFYGHYDWYTMPEWGADEATAWIKENKQVNIQAIHSGGASAQKLNTMIATNDLPDIIWLERGADVEKLRAAGMLVSYDEFLDKYDNLKTWLGEEGINMLRSEDGKLYQYPNWYTSQPNGNASYVVNKKIYEELGSPKLETTDDLYNYLKLVKENYPNVVPFDPEIAKDGQGLDVLYSAFREDNQKYPSIRAVPDGDKLVSIFSDEAFIESSKYAAKLFRERLITQDAMTQTIDQVQERLLTGRTAVYASQSPTDRAMLAHTELTKQDPDAGYFVIWPIHKEGLDPNKIYPGTYSQLGWNVMVITKAAKDPEKIFAFLDWYSSPEGQSVLMWGPPGKYWDGVQEDGYTPIFTEKYATESAALAELQGKTVNLNWLGNTVFVDGTKANYEATLPEEQQNWGTKYQRTITWKTQSNSTEFMNLDPMPESEEGIIRQRIEDIVIEARAKALFAKSDEEVEKILAEAEKDAFDAGYQKLLDFKTAKWQENLAKMAGTN